MVEVVKADRGPRIEIHGIQRVEHGNGVFIRSFGEMKIAAKEYVYAREFKLNSIETLQLTPHTGDHHLYHAQKYIHNKGEYDNYASVDIFSAAGYEMLASGRGSEISAATELPEDGSIWLDFDATGPP
jgi:hypothetical protein